MASHGPLAHKINFTLFIPQRAKSPLFLSLGCSRASSHGRRWQRYAVLVCTEEEPEHVRKAHGATSASSRSSSVTTTMATTTMVRRRRRRRRYVWIAYRAARGERPQEEEGGFDGFEGYNGFVGTGSCSNAHDDDPWIRDLVCFLQMLIARRKKVLGICFGHQFKQMAEKVSTLILKVDLECCRCNRRIKKILCKLQERENIKSIVYDEKNNTVTVSGTFNPQCLSKKLRRKACKACLVIKDIQIQEDKPKPKPEPPPPPKPEPPPPPKPEPPPPPKPAPEPPKPEPPKPAPEPPKPAPPPPPPKPAPEPPKPAPPPPPPKPEPAPAPKVVEVPYPYPVWPVCCWQPCPCPCYDYRGGRGGCRCCSCGREDSGWNPPPPSYGYGGGGGGGASWCDGVGYKIVCEEEPQYTCTVM